MTCYLLPAEIWQLGLAMATMNDLLDRIGEDGRIFAPHYLSPTQSEGCDPRTIFVDVGEGFRPRDEIEGLLRRHCGIRSARSIVPSAHPNLNDSNSLSRPNHRYKQIDRLRIVTVDTSPGHYRHLRSPSVKPNWLSYSAGAPIFTHNTNDFDEPAPPSCDWYFILASGLLGYRLVIDSTPHPDASITVYDINPDQLLWSRFVLENAASIATLPELVARFRTAHSSVTIRSIEAHECSNAQVQNAWYADHRFAIADLARHDISWIAADIVHDPGSVFSKLGSPGRTFFMYLDVFLPWLHHGREVTVLDLTGLARQFREEVMMLTNRHVVFLPALPKQAPQLQADSPWRET